MAGHNLTPEEKRTLVEVGAAGIIIGHLAPVDDRTVITVAITSGAAAALSETGNWRIEHYEDLSQYQRIIAWGVVGAVAGLFVDALLRPKLNPEPI